MEIAALLGLLGPFSVAVALIVIGALSKRLGAQTHAKRHYLGFYFAAALMLKDLKLSQDASAAAGAATPLGAHAAALYEAFNAAGHAGTDFSGIVNFLRDGGAD